MSIWTFLMVILGILLVAAGAAGALLATLFGRGGVFDGYRSDPVGIAISAAVAVAGAGLIAYAAVL